MIYFWHKVRQAFQGRHKYKLICTNFIKDPPKNFSFSLIKFRPSKLIIVMKAETTTLDECRSRVEAITQGNSAVFGVTFP